LVNTIVAALQFADDQGPRVRRVQSPLVSVLVYRLRAKTVVITDVLPNKKFGASSWEWFVYQKINKQICSQSLEENFLSLNIFG